MGFSFNRPKEATVEELKYERDLAQTQAAVERRQLEMAFLRYSEAAVGMVPMVEATGPANRSLEAWFDVVSAALAAGLTRVPEDHFRVAIWADLGDPEAFRMLGSANHDRNDPKMRELRKSETIGGHAWRSKGGEYLCADIAKDRKFKVRSGLPRPYKSIFAIRVGEPDHRWGVITIDAPRLNCFGPLELMVIRRFARLVSAGAAIAIARYAPGRVPTSPRAALGPMRIVSPSATQEAAKRKEPPDDQS